MNTFAVWIIYWLILIKIFLPDSENNKVDENIDLEIQDKNEEVREEITINTVSYTHLTLPTTSRV